MPKLRAILVRLMAAMGERREHSEIDAELSTHIAMHTEDGVQAGLSEDEARRRALIRLGGREQVRQAWRERRTLPALEALMRDARYALRRLAGARGFTLSAVVTLALGIGANAAVFSLIEAVLLRPLPYKDPERLVVVWQSDAAHHSTGAFFNTYREFEAWQQNSHSFEQMAALTWATGERAVLWREKPIDLLPIPASADFFAMLGASAQIGRTFGASDLHAECTVVLSHQAWEQKLGAPADIVGQDLKLGDAPCQIVGVMPKSFSFYPAATDLWTLITPTSEFARKPWDSQTGVFARMRPGVTRAAAEADLAAIQTAVMRERAGSAALEDLRPDVLPLQDNFTWLAGRNLRTGLWVLFGASGLILLMTCLNVANLLIGHSMEREREIAVRTALGSGRARLFSQLFIESLALAVAGAGCGVLLAVALLRWFRAANPVELPPGSVVVLDWPVLVFSAGAALVCAMVFGLLPAWRGSRTDPVNALRSGHGQSARGAAQRASQLVVVAQVALSMVLLAGTGMLSESLFRLASARLGYRTDHIFTAWINLPEARYADTGARARFAAAFAERAKALPSVEAAGLGSNFTPVGVSSFSIQGDAALAATPGSAATQSVSDDYLAAMEIPLERGRFFDGRDRTDTQPVAVINETLARKYFPQGDALGRAIKLSRADDPAEPWLTIVGVVSNIRTTTVFQEMGYVTEPAVYRPLAQSAPASLALMVASIGGEANLTGDLQRQLSALDGGLVLSGIGSMEGQHASSLAAPRFRAVLAGGFAMVALTLALVGLYGVLSRLVLSRRREIGIRMALGADRRRVLNAILARSFAITACGIALGIAGAAIAERFIRALLYEVRSGGAVELAAVAAVMMLIAGVAAWRPARQAASTDPIKALRTE